jgi:hypothetical protein
MRRDGRKAISLLAVSLTLLVAVSTTLTITAPDADTTVLTDAARDRPPRPTHPPHPPRPDDDTRPALR